MQCECEKLGIIAVVDIGKMSGVLFQTLERVKERGEPYWWLAAYRCQHCRQWWFVAHEEQQNDVICLRRLTPDEVACLQEHETWPDDFDRYETVILTGAWGGRSAVYLDTLQSPHSRAMAKMAREQPGISVTDLGKMLNVDRETAEALARAVIEAYGVEIEML